MARIIAQPACDEEPSKSAEANDVLKSQQLDRVSNSGIEVRLPKLSGGDAQGNLARRGAWQ
jgi:hypothetical protein